MQNIKGPVGLAHHKLALLDGADAEIVERKHAQGAAAISSGALQPRIPSAHKAASVPPRSSQLCQLEDGAPFQHLEGTLRPRLGGHTFQPDRGPLLHNVTLNDGSQLYVRGPSGGMEAESSSMADNRRRRLSDPDTTGRDARDAQGRYLIQRPHLSQVVRSYHPPGSGYHHEVQHHANCGLHVHQQQLMFYSGNNFDLLASQDAVDRHITALGPGPGGSVEQRRTLYQFDDLASFSQTVPNAPVFSPVLGANLQLGQPLTLPAAGPANPSSFTRADIDRMPAIGVTLRMRRGAQEVEHSVQIIRLAGQPPGFIEVDPRRNPALPNEQPRRLRGTTMAEALEHLVSSIGVDRVITHQGRRNNLGRNIDLHLPTRASLQAWQALNLPLPQLQQQHFPYYAAQEYSIQNHVRLL